MKSSTIARSQEFGAFVIVAMLSSLFVGCSGNLASKHGSADLASFEYSQLDTTECPRQVIHQALKQPRKIPALSSPEGHSLLDTKLVVEMRDHPCIPARITTDEQGKQVDPYWTWKRMRLRTYGSPREGNNPSDPHLEWSIPGPTFQVRKAYLQDPQRPPSEENREVKQGTRFRLRLENALPNNSYPYHQCEPAEYFACPEDRKERCPWHPDQGRYVCTSAPSAQCVRTEVPQHEPQCFHGADVTNLHYHGTHVSPQPHQDYVLLKLFSRHQTDPPPPCGPQTDKPDCPQNIAIGSYQTDINPLPWNQAPGTHWYHPHHHGSTALQVLNGLAGALLVEGPFDDWLESFYQLKGPERERFEKLLVVGQTWPEPAFWANPLPPGFPPYPLVNGQAIPKIEMQYGEVQRWRFIGATTQSSAELALQFPDGFEVRQIAQDGIQFAPKNYGQQPLAVPVETDKKIVKKYLLAPGNRLDFLVKAPTSPLGDGRAFFYITQKTFGHLSNQIAGIIEDRAEDLQKQLGLERAVSLGLDENYEEALFRVDLVGRRDPMSLPTEQEWPPMPYYLRDIRPEEVINPNDPRLLAFSMTRPDGQETTAADPLNGFWINEKQYDPLCADETMTLETAEKWRVTNDSSPNHPFHIHINPFQVTQVKGNYENLLGTKATFDRIYDPPVWQDTIALPGPYGRDGTEVGYVYTLQRFEDYSGAFVLHCHFLGHEDRGMMFNVQTICPDNGKYGTPRDNGRADDCRTPAAVEPNPFPVPPNPECGQY